MLKDPDSLYVPK